MKSKLLIAAALIALVAAGCNKAADNADNSADNNQQQNQTPSGQTPTTNNPNGDNVQNQQDHSVDANVDANLGADAADMPQVVGVNITPTGFSPATITIKKGDYVQFTNTDTATHWPASDPHPTHTGYPGFDAEKALKNGENYRFQFNKVGTWGYHDHLHPNLHGTVIVQ